MVFLLGAGTANTWWILLHSDRKSRHRRIKKQRRYERLAATQAKLCLWGEGVGSMGPEGGYQDEAYFYPRVVLLHVYSPSEKMMYLCLIDVNSW